MRKSTDGKGARALLPDGTGKTANPFAVVGQQIVGFGRFSSTVPLGMITRDTSNAFRIYDVVQNFDATGAPFYTAALSSVNGGILISSANGVQSTMTLAGFAPISGPLGAAPITNDMVLRDTITGKFYFYDIKDDALTVSGELPQPPAPSAPDRPGLGGWWHCCRFLRNNGLSRRNLSARAGDGGPWRRQRRSRRIESCTCRCRRVAAAVSRNAAARLRPT
jgi:hypothetical protein